MRCLAVLVLLGSFSSVLADVAAAATANRLPYRQQQPYSTNQQNRALCELHVSMLYADICNVDPSCWVIDRLALKCQGPAIVHISGDKALARFKGHIKGVDWKSEDNSSVPSPDTCALTIRGSSKATVLYNISRGNFTEQYPQLTNRKYQAGGFWDVFDWPEGAQFLEVYDEQNVLCISDMAQIVMLSASYTGLDSFVEPEFQRFDILRDRAVVAVGGHATFTVKDSRFDMKVDITGNAHAVIESSTFYRRLVVSQNASVVIEGGLFQGPRGCLHMDEHARVNVSNSVFAAYNDAYVYVPAAFNVDQTTRVEGGPWVLPSDRRTAAFVAAGNISVLLTSSTFHDNIEGSGGDGRSASLRAIDNAYVEMRSCIFTNNTVFPALKTAHDSQPTYRGGLGGGLYASGNANIEVHGCSFLNNTAPECGAIAVTEGATLFLVDSRVTGNVAEQHICTVYNCSNVEKVRGSSKGGGGMCAHENATIMMDQVRFQGNEARQGAGGGIYVESGRPSHFTIKTSFFEANVAAGSGGGIGLMNGNISLDMEGTIVNNNTAGFNGGGILVSSNASLGLLRGTDLHANQARSGGDELDASANATIVFGHDTSIGVCSPGVLWLTRNCTVGQVMDAGYCQCCPANTYTPVVGATSCDACPANANCTGGDAIVSLAGFWHSHKYSSQLHRCPRPEACLYGGICAEGHTGNACGSCAPGYGSLSPFHCRKCLARGSIIAIYFGVTAAAFFLVSYLVHSTLEDNVQGVAASRPSDYLKLLIRHLQYLVIIGSLQIEWPAALTGIFAAAGAAFSAAGSAGVVSMECVLSDNSSVPVPVQKLLLQLGLPIVVMVAVLLVRGLVCAVSRGARQVPASVILVVSCLVGLFTFLPFFVRSGLSLFACYSLDASTSDPYPEFAVANASRGYWVHDMGQACWQGWHKAWAVGLGVPLLAALCVGVPLGTLLLLVLNRRRLGEAGFKAYVGFLYHQYSARCFYWEAVSSLQVMLLTAISVFSYTLGAYNSTFLLNVLLVLFWVLQQAFKPSAFKDLHLASFASIGCLYATTCVAWTYFTYEKVATPQYKAAAGVGVLVANAIFLLGSLVVIVVKSKGPVAKACRKVLHWLRGGGWSEGPDVMEQKPSFRESTLAAV